MFSSLCRMWRGIFTAGLMVAVVVGFSGVAHAVLINYVAPTGQTATADYTFINSTTLQIVLTETTPAGDSTLTGGPAILTSVGFLLPGTTTIVSGTVVIGPTSASVGFDIAGPTPPADFGPGADVSGEWGATSGKQPMDSVGNFDFVSTNTAQVVKFPGANRDGPAGLDGPQGGLLDDSAARGGLGVIDNSVIITLTLSAPLTAAEQATFLASLSTDSIVEWGSNDAFGRPPPKVAEPGTLLLLGSGLVGLGFWRRKMNPS